MKIKKWTREQLVNAADRSRSIRQVLGILGLKQAGGNYFQIRKYLTTYKINTDHFTGRLWNKGLKGIGKPRPSLDEVLVQNSTYQSFKLKRRLFLSNLKPQECEECGWAKQKTGGYLPLELHHVNGDKTDNRLENLIVLCPNCHSLKPNHRGRNSKKARVL